MLSIRGETADLGLSDMASDTAPVLSDLFLGDGGFNGVAWIDDRSDTPLSIFAARTQTVGSDVDHVVINLDSPLDTTTGEIASLTLTEQQGSSQPYPGSSPALYLSAVEGAPGISILGETSFGPHHVTSVVVYDEAGDATSYTADQLRQMGDQTSFEIVDSILGSPIQGAAGNDVIQAPISGHWYFQAGGSQDTVVLNGNVGDYTLSRVQPTQQTEASFFSHDDFGTITDQQQGAFLLTATNGSGAYAIEESISTVRFEDGQYLSLKDLPAYISGDTSLEAGGGQDDILYQSRITGYELFVGGAGNDQLYLKGNTSDYTVRTFTATTPTTDYYNGDQTHHGLELISKNGSGALFIDQSVETVHFQNGQYLAYGDVTAYVSPDHDTSNNVVQLSPDGITPFNTDYTGLGEVLLNQNPSDLTLSRDGNGNFIFTSPQTGSVATAILVDSEVKTIQFLNGQYLAVQDLPSYLKGSGVFTNGTVGDDTLITALSGDQYISGGGGIDNVYLHGNVGDYKLTSASLQANGDHQAIDGYELVANNGSGNLYIDQSTETVHFQNGQYLAFNDLPAYIDPFHG